MPRRGLRCTNHCGRCGQHFHNVAAFDAHRRGKYRPKPGERGRYCVAAEDAADSRGKDLFVALTEHGVCDLHGKRKMNVTVWMLRNAFVHLSMWNGDAQPTLAESRAPAPQPLPRPARGGGSGKRRKRRRLEDVR